MGICWYCHWGWPKKVADIYIKAVDKLDGDDSPLEFGPGHIVWSDENFDCAEKCLEWFNDHRGDFSDEDMEIVRESLEELAKIPLKDRCVEPEDYDQEHPELFPPAPGVEMVKR